MYVALLTNDVGVVIRILLHLVETTEQKRLDARFAQSPKMQADGQHAGGIANDFNNLLTAMIGFCDLLLKRCRPGEQVFGDVMQIKQNANRDASLVRQLLAFSRQQTLAPQCLQMAEIISAARDGAPDIPIISISDYTQGSVDHKFESIKNLLPLAKPFSLKQLPGTVRNALDVSRQSDV